MCGIAGAFDASGAPVPLDVLKRMGDAIAHRGPDGSGEFAEGPVGLASRRLAILDPTSRGRMPMTNRSDSHVITYNGEVYNFRVLQRELESLGHRFETGTDTEVVLAAYVEWGKECVRRFDGMFAIAIWDRERSELFLARDRYGVKPLYYAQVGDLFLFGSEVKALLAHGSLRAQVSTPNLLEYFTFQNQFGDGTIFRSVKTLSPGHHLTLRRSDRQVSPVQYWDFNFNEQDSSESDEEYVEELQRLFGAAVERQLVSDVPVGAQLSGGIDSGSVTAAAAQHLPWLTTFTVGFDQRSSGGLEIGIDEREKAETMSYLFKTEHYEAVLKSGDMERCMPSLIRSLEDLRVGQSYPNYYVARLASKFVKVVLTGSGGDEIFAGYPWRYYRAVVNDSYESYVEKYYNFWHRLVPNDLMPSFFKSEVWNDVKDISTREIFREALPDHEAPRSPEEYINHSLHLEAKTFLQGLFLVEDKLSMAYGLENRVPFMDNELVEFAQRLPVRLKLRDLQHVVELDENEPGPKTARYFEKTRDGKMILRKAMEQYIPEEITDGVKRGFSGPDASWYRGDSTEYVQRELMSSDAAIYEFLNPKTVKKLVQGHIDGDENRRLLLWSLMSFECWCRTFLQGEQN